MDDNKKNIAYMVEFLVPQEITREFTSLIPAQQLMLNKLMQEGSIQSYCLSMQRDKVWMTAFVEDEDELLDMLEMLPLTLFMEYKYQPLMFHSAPSFIMPAVSLN